MSLAMDFCPNCANLLDIEAASGNQKTRFTCLTCPYVYPIKTKIVREIKLVRKEIEPIFEADDMKYAPKTAATCPKCHNGEAYFRQIQIRSADEPMTTFYRCCNDNCRFDWRED
ncbi:DNA-directed RNA polymerase III subunit RPC10-like [Phalaenopsis equestris]|uniref:DNA-directed RNA polymerase III subunit RPC10-like n=1 Tax=Phalaenopsis equestris TaxID=78828 RepID=UPI0009E4523B|nr:DNA-directed RNA polymerase III subunit RPC10-like [Phalaenopsis equestris]